MINHLVIKIHKQLLQYSTICNVLLTANASADQFRSFDWRMCLLNEILLKYLLRDTIYLYTSNEDFNSDF